jgi:cellulose synthase/poly-beta-1,6-N-acetylglucosamine synthase-like glycosyltransferase
MSITPILSVVIPLYNKEAEIGRALHSISAQTFDEFEVIVVDDGSTDCGPKIVREWQDVRIRLVSQHNAGVSAARNRGITEARASLIAFLDADDEWSTQYLEHIVELQRRFPHCGVYATSYTFRYAGLPGRPAILRGFTGNLQEGVLTDYFTVACRSDPPLWTSAVVVTKSAILEVGGFPVGIIAGEDLLLWARLAVRFSIAYCPTPLSFYWEPMAVTERPPRHPQVPDQVSEGLLNLRKFSPPEKVKGLDGYLGLWHRMRGVTYLKMNRGAEAREELRSAVSYESCSARIIIHWVLSLLPGQLPARAQINLSILIDRFRSFTSGAT